MRSRCAGSEGAIVRLVPLIVCARVGGWMLVAGMSTKNDNWSSRRETRDYIAVIMKMGSFSGTRTDTSMRSSVSTNWNWKKH